MPTEPASRPRVAVFSTEFLPYSQTFVHDELMAHRRYEPHVFCARRLHTDRFPYPAVFVGGRSYEFTRVSPMFDRALEAGRYSLIHAHFGTGAVYAVPFARRHNLPLVVTFHGFDVPLLASTERFIPKYFPYAVLGPSVLRHLTLGLCASIELYEMLREMGVPASRLKVHRIGIDIDRVTAAASNISGPPRDDQEPLVVMVGRFVPKKGLAYGIRAFAAVRRRRGRGRLVIAGDGELRKTLEAIAREEKVTDAVTFAGPIPHAQVLALVGRADVLLAPSVTTANGDRESGTIAVKEASAAGAVPIATWHGGLPEIIDDGRTGYLVPERDVASMERRLDELLSDPALRRRLAEAGRLKMRAEYDNRVRVAALADSYDEAVAAGRS